MYTYTAGNQLLTEDGPFDNDTVTNVYSNRLRTNLSLQQPTGVWTNLFVFDAAKRLTNVTSPAGISVYSYRAGLSSLQPARVSLPNTSYITNTYDNVARLTGTYLKSSGNGTIDSYAYIYNPANERTNLTRFDSSTVAYKYDKIGQLKVADSSVNAEDCGYDYDSAWNLSYRTNNGVLGTFAVDGKNELTSDPTCVEDDYDANGNLIMRKVQNAPTNLRFREYGYDEENRLALIVAYTNVMVGCLTYEDAPYWQTDFAYDGLGRLRTRLEYQIGGSPPMQGWELVSKTEYIYDGWRVIQERDVNNTPTVSYTRGTDLSGSLEGAGGIGGLLARSSGYSSGNWTAHNYYFADGNGNITYMLNSSQTMVASYRYDPFGNTISSSGTLAGANVYRFSSKEAHIISGMYYYGCRFYDPNLQKWINTDPQQEVGFETAFLADSSAYGGIKVNTEQTDALGGSPTEELNLYLFVKNAPTEKIDALGLKIFCKCAPPIATMPTTTPPQGKGAKHITATAVGACTWTTLNSKLSKYTIPCPCKMVTTCTYRFVFVWKPVNWFGTGTRWIWTVKSTTQVSGRCWP